MNDLLVCLDADKRPLISPPHSFRTRSSSRERTPSNPPTPILVRRESLGSSNPHRRPPVRRPSLPPTRTSLPPLMVPLRDCCADCMPIVEESLREGDAWSEHFTRGARRRRSLSVDSAHGHKHVHTASFASIKVDEAASGPPAHRCPSPPPPTSVTVTAATLPSQFGLGPSLTRRIPSDSSASEGGVIDLTEPVPPKAVPTPPAPIQEEDEEELFPLPSPRRSPSGSPLIPSPAGSTASLVVRNSPALSPAIAALKQQNYPGELKPPPSPSLSVSVPRTYSPVRRTSPATSPTMPYRSPATSPTIGPPSPGVKTPSSHHSWSSFFRGGASVLKGMNSIAG
jgi:hypothetical protein